MKTPKTRVSRRYITLPWLTVAALVLLHVATGDRLSADEAAPKVRPAAVWTVPGEARTLVPVLLPAMSADSVGTEPAALVVKTDPPSPIQTRLLGQLKARRVIGVEVDATVDGGATIILDPNNLPAAALAVATRFWTQAPTVVVVPVNHTDRLLAGSSLAAVERIPLLVAGADPTELAPTLHKLGTRTLLWIGPDGPAPVFQQIKTIRLSIDQATRRMIDHLGPASVRGLVVVRRPEPGTGGGAACWLAPYIASARRSPVVMVDTGDGKQIEKTVYGLIAAAGLSPRSITLVGSHAELGTVALAGHPLLGEYELDAELFTLPEKDRALGLAVGRIPFEDLDSGLAMFVSGLVRPEVVRGRPARMLMVANPQTEFGTLPLAETISRLTAAEWLGAGLPVDEFYRVQSDDPRVLKVAPEAHLVLFEGHVTDQRLFPAEGGGPIEFEMHDGEVGPPMVHVLVELEWLVYDLVDAMTAMLERLFEPQPQQLPAGRVPVVDGPFDGQGPAWPMPDNDPPVDPGLNPEDDGPPPGFDVAPPAHTLAMTCAPVVVLQSCHSLELPVTQTVLNFGGCALVGSTTNIHSASGSSIMKAFTDSLLQRQSTVGEALRDARNYVFLLGRLKAARGHNQQSKAYRVALSFRLWGDPEVVLVDQPPRLELRPVDARWSGRDRLALQAPLRRLPAVVNEKYIGHIFPGAQTGDIVKRLKNKPQRRLMPLYFARLNLDDNHPDPTGRRVVRDGDESPRAVALADPFKRHLYVLYFPEKDKARETIDLHFVD